MTVEQRAATQVARTLQDRLPRAFAVIAVSCAVVGAFDIPSATPLAVQFVGLLSVAALTIFSARGIERYHLDLLRRDEERNALLDIARDLTGEFDIGQVFDRVQQRIALLVDCDSVATYFLDRTAGVFRLTSYYGINSDKLQAVHAIPLPGPSPAGSASAFTSSAACSTCWGGAWRSRVRCEKD